MTTGEHMKVELRNGYALLTLTGTVSVLSSAALREMHGLLQDLDGNGSVRAVIIRGEKNFCAGADIREMRNMTPETAQDFSRLGHAVFNCLETLSKGVIAAVGGHALGGGCELALACDIRIAGESARFGQPEVNLGLIPGFGGTQRLPRVVGPGRAREMILTGRLIDAREAARIGLVTAVVPDAELLDRAEETARLLAQKSPVAVRTAKLLLTDDHGAAEGYAREIDAFTECFGSPDRVEGMTAFLEKRMPRFRE